MLVHKSETLEYLVQNAAYDVLRKWIFPARKGPDRSIRNNKREEEEGDPMLCYNFYCPIMLAYLLLCKVGLIEDYVVQCTVLTCL